MNTDKIRLAVDVATLMTKIMGPNRKGIFFCSTIEEADIIGAKFTGNCISHSKIGFRVKAENEANWKAGQSQWIAATTGMICGIDDSNVGVVIFVGLGYGLVNLYQGSGRGGRDGTPCWSIVLQSSNSYMAIPPNGLKDDPQCIEESELWLWADECRRLGFSSLLDGAKVSCFDLPEAHFCDFCKPELELITNLRSMIVDPPIQPPVEDNYDSFECDLMNMDFEGIFELSAPPTPAVSHPPSDPLQFAPTPGAPSMQIERQVAYHKAAKSSKEAKSKVLNGFTTKLLGKCPLCWAYQGILVPRHTDGLWIRCRGTHGRGFMEMGLDRPFKKKIKFARYKFCWKCHLPQDKFTPPSHPNLGSGNKGKKDCPHEDFVVLLVLYIRKDADWWRRACQAFGLSSNMSEEDLSRWYTAETVQGGFNNSLELIIWFYMEKERERKES
jgi:hypothetical protein